MDDIDDLLRSLPPAARDALARARLSGAGFLHGHPELGSYAISASEPAGGLRLRAFEEGCEILSLLVAQADREFDPRRDLREPSGPLWDAIRASDAVPGPAKIDRAWETWREIFAGMALLSHWDAPPGQPAPTTPLHAPRR